MLQPVTHPTDPQPAHVLTLYQVPVPGAVQVQLPDGRTALGRPVEHHPDPLRAAGLSPGAMPGWAKAVSVVAGSLTLMALGSAAALRIAAPALGGLVDRNYEAYGLPGSSAIEIPCQKLTFTPLFDPTPGDRSRGAACAVPAVLTAATRTMDGTAIKAAALICMMVLRFIGSPEIRCRARARCVL